VNGTQIGYYWYNSGSPGNITNLSLTVNTTGNALITVVGYSSGLSASFTTQVKNPAAINPMLTVMGEAFTAGSKVTLNALGFKGNEMLKFYVNNTEIASVAADAGG
jgi:hypothetical protein